MRLLELFDKNYQEKDIKYQIEINKVMEDRFFRYDIFIPRHDKEYKLNKRLIFSRDCLFVDWLNFFINNRFVGYRGDWNIIHCGSKALWMALCPINFKLFSPLQWNSISANIYVTEQHNWTNKMLKCPPPLKSLWFRYSQIKFVGLVIHTLKSTQSIESLD